MLKRQSNFELLRIICMLMIIMQHLSLHSHVKVTDDITLKNELFHLMAFGGHIAVNCFVIITGYFQSRSLKSNNRKIINVYLKMWIYSVVMLVISIVTGSMSLSLSEVMKAMMPFSSGRYWFITVYIILLIIAPLINKSYLSFSRYEKILLLVILFIANSILPTITMNKLFYLWSYTGTFLMCYLIGALFRDIIEDDKIVPCAVGYILIFLSLFFIWASIVFSDITNQMYFRNTTFTVINTVPVVMCACGLFIIFSHFKFYSKRINSIASGVLAVYLIHDNPRIRELLFNKILNVQGIYDQPTVVFCVKMFLSIVIIFCGSLLVDKVLFQILNAVGYPKIPSWIEQKIANITAVLKTRLNDKTCDYRD